MSYRIFSRSIASTTTSQQVGHGARLVQTREVSGLMLVQVRGVSTVVGFLAIVVSILPPQGRRCSPSRGGAVEPLPGIRSPYAGRRDLIVPMFRLRHATGEPPFAMFSAICSEVSTITSIVCITGALRLPKATCATRAEVMA